MTTDPPATPIPGDLDRELAELTRWTGGDTALWKAALDRVEGKPDQAPAPIPISRGVSPSRRLTFWAGQLAAMLVVATLASIMAVSWTHTQRPGSVVNSADLELVSNQALTAEAEGLPAPAVETMAAKSVAEPDSASLFQDRLLMAGPVPQPPMTQAYADFGQMTNAVSTQHPGTPLTTLLTEAAQDAATISAQPSDAPTVPPPAASDVASLGSPLASPAPGAASPSSGGALAFEQSAPAPDARERSVRQEKAAFGRTTEVAPTPPAVRIVRLSIAAEDVRSAYVAATKAGAGGDVLQVRRSRWDAAIAAEPATVQLSVPLAELDASLAALRALGKVTSESIDAEDLSERAAVLDAQIAAARQSLTQVDEFTTRRAAAGGADELESVKARSTESERLAVLIAQRDALLERAGRVEVMVTITRP